MGAGAEGFDFAACVGSLGLFYFFLFYFILFYFNWLSIIFLLRFDLIFKLIFVLAFFFSLFCNFSCINFCSLSENFEGWNEKMASREEKENFVITAKFSQP